VEESRDREGVFLTGRRGRKSWAEAPSIATGGESGGKSKHRRAKGEPRVGNNLHLYGGKQCTRKVRVGRLHLWEQKHP